LRATLSKRNDEEYYILLHYNSYFINSQPRGMGEYPDDLEKYPLYKTHILGGPTAWSTNPEKGPKTPKKGQKHTF